jgi:hypothetical protein
MRSLLAKIAIRKGVGLYLGEHELAVSKVAATPLGPIELASASSPYTPEDLPSVLERLLTPLVGRRRSVPVAVGLPGNRIFFGTRLIRSSSESSPQAVLQKALCSPNISIDDLTIDLLRGDVNKAQVASVAACRKKYMAGIVATLIAMGIRPHRAEPSPCALVRLAAQQHHFPRRSKTVLCVFLNATQGLAVVVAGGMPLAWRTFLLPAHAEGPAILSAARTLRTQYSFHGIESAVDFAILYGRGDLKERLQKEEFPSNMGTRLIWHDSPALDNAAMAQGVALGCLAQDAKAFDLSRTLKPRASIRDIFPWGELAFEILLIASMGGILGARSLMLDDAYVAVRMQSARHACLKGADQKKLEKQKKVLADKVDAVQKFLSTRISWSAYTQDIASRLPRGTVLESFDGSCELEAGGKKGGGGAVKKSFTLHVISPSKEDGSMSPELDSFFKSLRNHPLWLRDFLSVDVMDIKRAHARGSTVPSVGFTIVCSPKSSMGSAAPRPPAASGAAGGEAKKKHK